MKPHSKYKGPIEQRIELFMERISGGVTFGILMIVCYVIGYALGQILG